MSAMQTKPARAFALLAILTIAVILVSASSLLLSLRVRELRHASQESHGITNMLMEQTEKNFAAVDLVLQGVQERLSSTFGRGLALDSAPVQLLLSARAAGFKQVTALFIVDEHGMLVNSSREAGTSGMLLSDRDYFRVFAEGRPDFAYLDKPVRSRINNAWTLYLARRLNGRDGQFRGVVVAAIGVAELERNLSLAQLDYARPTALYMSDGTLVASQPHREEAMGRLAPEIAQQTLPTRAKQIITLAHAQGAQGPEQVSIGKIAEFPLLLSVTDLEELSLASWHDTAVSLATGAVLVCVFIGLVSAYLIGKIERKEALTVALNSANDRYQHTVDSVMDAIVAVDAQMSIILFNPAAEKMFGYPAHSVLGQPLDMLIPARYRSVHVRHMLDFNGGGDRQPRTVVPGLEIVGLRADGTEFPLESTFSKSVVNDALQMTAVLRDASDKRKAETDLREANSQLRDLTNSLTRVREEERTRISRELHDDLGQQLTGLKLSLSWLGNRIKDGRETAAQNVDDMRHQLDAAIASVRRIAAELRPRVLDDLDFAAALAWQTSEFTRHSGMEVTLNLEAGHLIKDNDTATGLFRIVQEALTNVVRHAQATKVHIELLAQQGRIELSIRDDGVGFDSGVRKGGVGLLGMRERCVAIGGTLGIVSQPGGGATIVVTVPLATEGQAKGTV